ncbi:hypothetical protein [Microbispora catharanthi]|nr:hypothetical protein [Microbispora catharanthi]
MTTRIGVPTDWDAKRAALATSGTSRRTGQPSLEEGYVALMHAGASG